MKFNFNTAYTLQAQNENACVEGVFTDVAHEYIVEKHSLASGSFECRLVIKREDRKPIRSWRLLQDIKNAVVGVDRTAVEIYPPEAEVTDTANIYHLWVYKPGFEPRVRLTPPIPETGDYQQMVDAYKRMMDGG